MGRCCANTKERRRPETRSRPMLEMQFEQLRSEGQKRPHEIRMRPKTAILSVVRVESDHRGHGWVDVKAANNISLLASLYAEVGSRARERKEVGRRVCIVL